jgi:hypothetical protein
MGQMRNTLKTLVGKSEGRDDLEDLGVDVRIMLQDWKGVDTQGLLGKRAGWQDVKKNMRDSLLRYSFV